jgi:hypothetical protein
VGDFGGTLEAAMTVLNCELEDDLKKLRREMQERFVLVIDLLAQELHNLLFQRPIGQCHLGHSQHVC